METSEEILDKVTGGNSDYITINNCLQAMKEYAQSCCEDVRQRCADEAKVIFHDGHSKEEVSRNMVMSGANHIKPDKQSILNTEIILP